MLHLAENWFCPVDGAPSTFAIWWAITEHFDVLANMNLGRIMDDYVGDSVVIFWALHEEAQSKE